MATIEIALLGLGTVGSGVVKIIKEHQQKIQQVTGQTVIVKTALVQHIANYQENVLFDGIHLTTNVQEILSDPAIAIVVEVMGTVDLARTYVIQAMRAQKHVVTANKDLIAEYGSELSSLAKEMQVDLFYEASVAGGIPILRTIVNSLSADEIQSVIGIVNGTTNFILTKMTSEGLEYEVALAQAQANGFAEADPTNDVDGWDAARKMTILARLAFGMNVSLEHVHVSGIRHLQVVDIEQAAALGYVIKLLGTARLINQKLYLEVSSVLVPSQHPLAGVHNENNAVFLSGAAVGETMFYGPGAGSLPTATSVVSDIITVCKNIRFNSTGHRFSSYCNEEKLALDQEVYAKYYIRLKLADRAGVFLELAKIVANVDASLEKIQQEMAIAGQADVIIVTHAIHRQQLQSLIEQINQHPDLSYQVHFSVME